MMLKVMLKVFPKADEWHPQNSKHSFDISQAAGRKYVKDAPNLFCK